MPCVTRKDIVNKFIAMSASQPASGSQAKWPVRRRAPPTLCCRQILISTILTMDFSALFEFFSHSVWKKVTFRIDRLNHVNLFSFVIIFNSSKWQVDETWNLSGRIVTNAFWRFSVSLVAAHGSSDTLILVCCPMTLSPMAPHGTAVPWLLRPRPGGASCPAAQLCHGCDM